MNARKVPDPTFGVLILAGGRSSRMGSDKALLRYGSARLLDHIRSLALTSGAGRILVGGGPYGDLIDPVTGAGPVAALSALAAVAAHDERPSRWVVVPVDMPLLRPGLIGRLAAGTGPVFFQGHPLPLGLSLDKTTVEVLGRMGERLRAGESLSVRAVLDRLQATALVPGESELAQLVNANTPADWKMVTRSAPS